MKQRLLRLGSLLPAYSPIIVMISAIVLIWVPMFSHHASNRELAERAALTHAATLARALEEEFLRAVGAVDQTLQYIRDGYIRDPRHFRIEDWQQGGRFLTQSAFLVSMTDAKGIVISSNIGDGKPVDVSDREHIRVHLDGKADTLFISKPVLGRVSKKWAIQLTRRMEFPDGSLAGVIVGSFDPGVIAAFHSSVIIGKQGTISVIGDDGVVRVRSPLMEEGLGRDLSKTRDWAARGALPEGDSVYRQVSSIDNIERIFLSRRIRGTTMRLVVGQSTQEVFHATEADAVWDRMAAAIATLWLLALSWLMLRNQRSLAQARDKAEEGARAKSEFLATMSHEIRTPLNGVIGLADLLSSTRLDKQQSGLVQSLKTSANQLLGLLNDILDLSRLEAKKSDIEHVDFSIQLLAQEVIDLLRPGARDKGIELTLEIAPEVLPAYRGDPTRVRQILFNLIGNGIKFTDKGFVSLTITAEPSPGLHRHALKFTIADTGCGIPEDAIGKLFQEFSQVDSSISRRFGGTGLGLAISKRLANAMGGRIEVFSIVGIGTRFEVRILLDGGDVAKLPQPEATPDPRAVDVGGGLDILLAEDNRTNRFVISQQLQLLGQRVDMVNDGQGALEALATKRYDLILMDMMMPVMDGLEATKAIRRLAGPLSETRIIALTANSSAEDKEACRQAGMNGFLAKPVTRTQLTEVLKVELAMMRAANRAPGPPPGSSVGSLPSPPLSVEAQGAPAVAAFRINPDLCRDIGEAGAQEIVDIFVEECVEQLAELRQVLAGNDRPAFRRLVHSIKGSSAELGLDALHAVALKLEGEAMTADLDQLRDGVTRLDTLFDDVQSRIRAGRRAG